MSFRSSSSGSKKVVESGRGPNGKGSGSGAKRSHTTPEQEREAALQSVSQFMNPSPSPPNASSSSSTTTVTKDAPAHAVLLRKQPCPDHAPPKVDDATFKRKVISIIDELVNNGDFKVSRTIGHFQ